MRELLRYLRGYGKECVLSPLFKLLECNAVHTPCLFYHLTYHNPM